MSYWSCGQVMGTPELAVSWGVSSLGTPWQLASEAGSVLWDQLLADGACPDSRWLLSHLDGTVGHPLGVRESENSPVVSERPRHHPLNLSLLGGWAVQGSIHKH